MDIGFRTLHDSLQQQATAHQFFFVGLQFQCALLHFVLDMKGIAADCQQIDADEAGKEQATYQGRPG